MLKQFVYKFTLNITSSLLVPVITTNLPAYNVLEIGRQGLFNISASGSYINSNPS